MDSGSSSWLHALWGPSRVTCTPSEPAAPSCTTTAGRGRRRSKVAPARPCSASGAASQRAVIVGSRGTILHRQGEGWRAERAAPASLFGVYGHTGDSVYAVGDGGTVLRLQPE